MKRYLKINIPINDIAMTANIAPIMPPTIVDLDSPLFNDAVPSKYI